MSLRSLIDELEVDDAVEVDDSTPAIASRDPFFTAEVLGSLPSRLAFTGITPRQRIALLGLFHGVALAAGVGAAWTFGPEVLSGLAHHAHGWSDALDEVSWAWSLVAVVLVGSVALVATRTHTHSV
jgi:hypothetical protein